MSKKGIGRGKRAVLKLLQHLMAALAVICAAVIYQNAYFVLEYEWGGASTAVFPWDMDEEFEDTYIYTSFLREGISNVIRVSVIKNQLETDGVYDGRKKIDIYQYVNRKNNQEQPSAIHAEYYLEDLIKWYEYGFIYVHDISADDEFTRSGADAAGNEVLITITEEEGDAESAVETGEEQVDVIEYAEGFSVLEERYQTADGKYIADYVTNREEYKEFCNVLEEASSQLGLNYREYKFLNENYVAEKTNLRYCIQIPAENGYEYFTNEDMSAIGTDITSHYRSYGKYLYFYPKHLEYETNTRIEEDFIRSVVNEYEYVYPENSRIWIGVDNTYPVHDSLYRNKQQYDGFMPYYFLWIAFLCGAVLLYLVLWVYLTVKEGRPVKIGKEGQDTTIILGWFDRIPSELVGAGAAAVVAACIFLGYCAIYFANGNARPLLIAGVLAADAFVASAAAMQSYYSMVRKLKVHEFWKHTLVGMLCGWIIKWLKKGAGLVKRMLCAIRNDRSLIVRSWVLYLLFLAANAVLLIITFAFLVDGVPIWIITGILLLALDVGGGVMQYRENKMRNDIVAGIGEITKGNLNYQLETDHMYGGNLTLAMAVNSIGDGIRVAVETSMKDERLKADLITNVSHDIKTPLTSIINYVDLIKRENLQDEKIKGYVDVLDSKSQRLKQLTEDLVEASKISSGNIVYQFERINFVELIHQTLGEFSEKFEEKGLTVMAMFPDEPMLIQADSRRIWRVIENLYNNIYKYAMSGTRVYMDMARLERDGRQFVSFAVKNISAQPLNIKADELTERFIRGDVSRSTEGSGLGLSIAKNLTKAQNGEFTIYLDGDLFKVILEFPLEQEEGQG